MISIRLTPRRGIVLLLFALLGLLLFSPFALLLRLQLPRVFPVKPPRDRDGWDPSNTTVIAIVCSSLGSLFNRDILILHVWNCRISGVYVYSLSKPVKRTCLMQVIGILAGSISLYKRSQTVNSANQIREAMGFP